MIGNITPKFPDHESERALRREAAKTRRQALLEIEKLEVRGVPRYCRGAKSYPDGGYPSLKDAVEDAAMTAEMAANLIGVEMRQFKRIVDKGHLPHWAVVKVGNYTFYDKYAIDWLAKLHRLEKTRKSLKNPNITDYRRRILTERLKRKKIEYFAAAKTLAQDKNGSCILDTFDKVENFLRELFSDDLSLELLFLEEFGPDDPEEWDLIYDKGEAAIASPKP